MYNGPQKAPQLINSSRLPAVALLAIGSLCHGQYPTLGLDNYSWLYTVHVALSIVQVCLASPRVHHPSRRVERSTEKPSRHQIIVDNKSHKDTDLAPWSSLHPPFILFPTFHVPTERKVWCRGGKEFSSWHQNMLQNIQRVESGISFYVFTKDFPLSLSLSRSGWPSALIEC